MTALKQKKAGKKVTFFQYYFSTIVLAIAVALLIFLIYNLTLTNQRVLTISMLALTAGLLFESFRISDKWIEVIYILLAAIIISFAAFWPGKNEHGYDFESRLSVWPYCFIGVFLLSATIVNSIKTTVALSEGITLIQSLAIIYWIIEHKFYLITNWGVRLIGLLILLFCLFSIFSAFTRFQLSRTIKLTLSIWSSIIMLLFSIDNMLRVSLYPAVENTWDIYDGIYIGLQYFLLGVSAMYIVQNYLMLIAFLPNRNSNYFDDLKELKAQHIERYSNEQVHPGHAMICTVVTVAWYGINYTFNFLPSNTAIWIGFILFPLLLRVFTKGKS